MVVLFVIINLILLMSVWYAWHQAYYILHFSKKDGGLAKYVFYALFMLLSSYQLFGFIPGLDDPFFELHKTLNDCDYYPTHILTYLGLCYVFVGGIFFFVMLCDKSFPVVKTITLPFRELWSILSLFYEAGGGKWVKPVVYSLGGILVIAFVVLTIHGNENLIEKLFEAFGIIAFFWGFILAFLALRWIWYFIRVPMYRKDVVYHWYNVADRYMKENNLLPDKFSNTKADWVAEMKFWFKSHDLMFYMLQTKERYRGTDPVYPPHYLAVIIFNEAIIRNEDHYIEDRRYALCEDKWHWRPQRTLWQRIKAAYTDLILKIIFSFFIFPYDYNPYERD